MRTSKRQQHPKAGTVQVPSFHEGPTHAQGDVQLQQRYFTYKTDAGIVAGCDMSVMFTIDRPARDVWPYLKDFNCWQNSYGYYYSGVVGDLYSSAACDLGKETYRISIHKPNEAPEQYPYEYQVLRVIPERLIVAFQPVPGDGSTGGVSPGFHVFMLNEQDGRTVVTVLMEHAARTQDSTEEQALAPLRAETPEAMRFWRDVFIPNLKQLIYEAGEDER
jgi:hypothetical protein